MSAIRISRPGYPVRLIDQGPAVGRTTHTRAAIAGGITLVPSGSAAHQGIPPMSAGQTFVRWKAEPKPKSPRRPGTWERCGRSMRTGDTCGRRKGHGVGECKSVEAVERDNARRKARHSRGAYVGAAHRGEDVTP